MSNTVFTNVFRFFITVAVQVFLCNNINLFGFINPYVYVVFILLFPIKASKSAILISSFCLGLLVDVFSDSAGAHAAACVTLAYIRPIFLKLTFGVQYEYQNVKIANTTLGNLAIYCTLAVVLHHIILFWMEIFSIAKIGLILKNVVFTALFSIGTILLTIFLFNRSKT